MSDIQRRLPDILADDIQKCVYKMVKQNVLLVHGAKTNRTYILA